MLTLDNIHLLPICNQKFDPRLCNQASYNVLLHLSWSYEILHKWLIALFFSSDAHCAAGELENVSQHCWFACVSAKQLFLIIWIEKFFNWCALKPCSSLCLHCGSPILLQSPKQFPLCCLETVQRKSMTPLSHGCHHPDFMMVLRFDSIFLMHF